MRTSYIAGNWKMHKTRDEARSLAAELANGLTDVEARIMVAPPFTALETVRGVLDGSNIRLGAQNMAAAEEGAHTGEVSPAMLKDLGVETVIIGHSERRHSYGEGDELINQKLLLALRTGFEVILCVGETLEQREAGTAESVVKDQVQAGLLGVDESALDGVVIAYEPVWAIGTGKTATPEDADAMHASIRAVLGTLYSESAAEGMTIQYGGSVKPGNAAELMAKPNIDGALVGGASLKAETFIPIVRYKES
jgi:triosephosphate isomerase